MRLNENIRQYINSTVIGVFLGVLFTLTFPLVLKNNLESRKIPEYTLSLFGKDMIVYKDPRLVNYTGEFDVWRVDSSIFVLILPVIAVNIFLTYIIIKLNS